MEQGGPKFAYLSNVTKISSVWGTGGIEQGRLQCGLSVEWNRGVIIVRYRLIGTRRPSVCRTFRMDQGFPQFWVTVEWKTVFFIVGTGRTEHVGYHCGLPVE